MVVVLRMMVPLHVWPLPKADCCVSLDQGSRLGQRVWEVWVQPVGSAQVAYLGVHCMGYS